MAAILFGMGTAQAQEATAPKTPEEKAEQKLSRLHQKYNLSNEQQALLQPELVKSERNIYQKQQAASEARQQVGIAKRAQKAVILEVMEPEQQKRFEAEKQKRRAKKEHLKEKQKTCKGSVKAEKGGE